MDDAVFIIPAGFESPKAEVYLQIMAAFKAKGIKPCPVNIVWKRTTLTENLNQFLKQFEKSKVKGFYLFGFSFGAYLAFVASAKITPKAQILCSLSPYFKEDLSLLKNSWRKVIGKNRLEDIQKNYSFDELVKKVTCKTILIAGDEEGDKLERRVFDAYKKLSSQKELVVIKGAKHDIRQKEYLEKIKEVIASL